MNQLIYIVAGQALAAANDIKLTLPPSIGTNTGNYGTLIMTIVSLIFAFLAVMAFGGIIYSGVMMITSGGDATKFAMGKKNLVWSIIGIIVVTLSYFILRFVGSLVEGTI
jgi:small-conductance mechanosensitive channel